MVTSIDETCSAIQRYMDRSWQKLPISHQFPEPLPLQSTVSLFHGSDLLEPQSFLSVAGAIDFAIERTILPISITGRPGGGKTSAMKWIARLFADRRLQGQSKWLPVYIDLGQFNYSEDGRSLDSLIEQVMRRRSPVNYAPFKDEREYIIFLLDGLDILSGHPTARDILDEACQLREFRFIVAGRSDEQVTGLLNDYPSTIRIGLGSLDKQQREEWFRQHANASAQAKYFSLVTSNSHIDSLLESPLLFAMTASACIDEESAATFRTDMYSGRTGIFAGFVNYAIRRAIVQGNLPKGDDTVLEEHFPFVSGFLLLAARIGCRDRIPSTRTPQLLAELNRLNDSDLRFLEKSAWPRVSKILIAIGLLERFDDTYVFLHQQFAEYMAGYGLALRWLTASDERQLYENLATDLRFRDRDAIVSHALSVAAGHPSSARILDAAFQMIFKVAPTDVCELFSSTGAPELVAYLAPLVGSERTDQMVWLYAIQGLAKLPHQRAIQALEAIVTEHERYLPPHVRAAIFGLGKNALPEGAVAVVEIWNDVCLPDWIRLAAASVLPMTELNDGVLEFASGVLVDASRDDEVRTNALTVIERFDPSKVTSILRRLPKQSDLTLSFRMSVQAAEARLFARAQQPKSATLIPVPESLYKAELNNALWVLETSAMSSNTTENPVALAASAITRMRVLSPTLVVAEAENLIRTISQKGSQLHLVKDLTQLCAYHPEAWGFMERHPLLPMLNLTLVQSCALACGRRWIPEFNQNVVAAATPQESDVGPRAKKVSKKRMPKENSANEVMTTYITIRKSTGDKISLRDAEQFAARTGSPYNKNQLQDTDMWKAYMKELRNR